MTTACRAWWRNCALKPDAEVLAIDGMEDQIAPLTKLAMEIRELISSLELCHHKAERRVDNIIDAIGAGATEKGPGTGEPGRRHPAVDAWRNACAALGAWAEGRPSSALSLSIGDVPASRLLDGLGARSQLKEWQVQRVIDKIRSVIPGHASGEDSAAGWAWLLLGGGEHESSCRSECPEQYREHEDYWLSTAKTIIRDTENGDPAGLSLALAIDMLWPCHWRFVENLRIVLEAIGGRLEPHAPFGACARNIGLLPVRRTLEAVADALRAFRGASPTDRGVDRGLMARLGGRTKTREWLAASLEKTIRLQLDPPDDVRAMSALTGPEWTVLP